jgi:alkanesulfonate monooxygenase SsuD/methylene tetrahydromethanopterin reductase-like flavin-dependent oxidoreductase (luciferase family)
MTSDLQFGIAIPQFVADGAFDPAAFRSHLARAEALGVDSAWDRAGPRVDAVPDPIETMTDPAACTERIRLGCAVLVTPLHSPFQLPRAWPPSTS